MYNWHTRCLSRLRGWWCQVTGLSYTFEFGLTLLGVGIWLVYIACSWVLSKSWYMTPYQGGCSHGEISSRNWSNHRVLVVFAHWLRVKLYLVLSTRYIFLQCSIWAFHLHVKNSDRINLGYSLQPLSFHWISWNSYVHSLSKALQTSYWYWCWSPYWLSMPIFSLTQGV